MSPTMSRTLASGIILASVPTCMGLVEVEVTFHHFLWLVRQKLGADQGLGTCLSGCRIVNRRKTWHRPVSDMSHVSSEKPGPI